MGVHQKTSPQLVLSRRVRQTPFEKRVFEQGADIFTVYNHMPLASVFHSSQEDYAHLCRYVQLWDVACERQVEVVGPDALELVELVTPRDISKASIGQCMYTPLVDENGGIINDPIISRLAHNRFWVSIADSDVLLWLKGISYGRKYNVEVFEPDVSPLAVQGPRADDLMAELLGDAVRELKFFWFVRARLAGTSFNIARSGWGGQGGFEIYLEDSSKGLDLWDVIWEAGQKYNIRAGCPNLIDRLERGLFSYGTDITLANNPYECGLERFFENDKTSEYMSREALSRIRQQGPKKNIAYIYVDGDPLISPRNTWKILDETVAEIGVVTSLAYSPKFGTNLAFATIDARANRYGAELLVVTEDGEKRKAAVKNRFWR